MMVRNWAFCVSWITFEVGRENEIGAAETCRERQSTHGLMDLTSERFLSESRIMHHSDGLCRWQFGLGRSQEGGSPR